ncbi:TPA: hypothetical protein EYP38_05025 [Candidatus Micrarchaeota archaeon]|nr:hypothetical protein [Candidatus Micrarchaeota archaeon]
MRASLLSLLMLLIASGAAYALTDFGPHTALDCGAAPIVMDKADTYRWNPGAVGTLMKSAGGGPCITVDASDVIIDCDGGGGQEAMEGGGQGIAGIYISPGMDNITIMNCIVQNFFGRGGNHTARGAPRGGGAAPGARACCYS